MAEETRMIFYDQLKLSKSELDAVSTNLEAGFSFAAKMLLDITIARLRIISSEIKVPEGT